VCLFALHDTGSREDDCAEGRDLEATTIQQKEVQAYQLNDGEASRVKRSATVWLVFYAVAATVGLITKAG
jgi:hypothetical protein